MTVLVAGGANLAIAVAKAVAGLLSGSAAMLSEAAHSVADTITEALLFTALRRGNRPADEHHPFGYGKESYVWAFLAALFTFVAGAGFSILEGVEAIGSGEQAGPFGLSYVVLAIAFVVESVSLTQVGRQVRGRAARWRISPLQYLRNTPDTAIRAVAFEDIAALIGLVLAAGGLGLAHLTGSAVWDGLASVAIGLLLLVIALILARTNVSLLVGRAVPRSFQEIVREELLALPGVDGIHTLLTMQLGPNEVLIAAKVDFVDSATGADIEATADEAERRLVGRYEGVKYVFLDPTRSR